MYYYSLLISVLNLEEWLIVCNGKLGDDSTCTKNIPVL
jgi:hypothetical protein